jgi:hypothetical protein
MASDGVDAQAAARWAVDARNALKLEARDAGPRVLKWGAEQWNNFRYGNPVGPSADFLLRNRAPGAVIQSSGNTNPWVNWLLRVD